jgi:IS5 family transposase
MAIRRSLPPTRTAASSATRDDCGQWGWYQHRPRDQPEEPGEVYGDSALSVETAIEAKAEPRSWCAKGHRWLPAKALEAHNRPLRPIRARIEKIFGTWKRSYHFRSMRWLGLAKAKCQVHLAAIAYNLRRDWRMQAA